MELKNIKLCEIDTAMEIINSAKAHLRAQGIDQWQTGYPDRECIEKDALNQTGFFVVDDGIVLGYLCIDFTGEPAYELLNGSWASNQAYVVVHRMAFNTNARGKNLSSKVFELVEQMSIKKGVRYFRVDTDEDNKKMQHILTKNGFVYCGTIWFDNSEKIAFDKLF